MTQSEECRRKAAEIRKHSETALSPEARKVFWGIAADYEQLAKQVEQCAKARALGRLT